MTRSKLMGGILLIVGTSIGGGMLALPVSTAEMGFANSLFFFNKLLAYYDSRCLVTPRSEFAPS